MSTIVKVPNNTNADYDFIAFSFKGKHSYEDFGIYRVSDDNSGYNEDLTVTITGKTADITGADGQYYFGAQHKNKIFNIKFAFDGLTENKLQQMKSWLSGKEIGYLWFAEAPHKVYSAKVTGSATIATVAFDENIVSQDGASNKERVYKGNGSVQFTCYYPYARTPDYVIDSGGNMLDGNHYTSYSDFANYDSIKEVLPRATNDGYGDMNFDFVAYLDPLNSSEASVIVMDANNG